MARYRNIALLIGCSALSGCMQLPFMFGGEPCDRVWDRIDYKKCYEDNVRASGDSPQPLQEKPPEENFGACAEDDLANHCK